MPDIAECFACIARRLLPVIEADAVIGPIHPFWVARHGFAPDCQVLPFSGDNPCSLIGLGLVLPGQVALSLGTSDTLFACMDEARVSDTGEGALFASPDGEHYMALICFLNGSLAREAVRDRYGLDWDDFARALQSTPAGNGGGLMLPWFEAEIVPNVQAGVVRHELDEADADEEDALAVAQKGSNDIRNSLTFPGSRRAVENGV